MTELENYKFKKSQELLNKPDIGEIGSFILGFDAAMEYKNQFSQLPTSVTDKDIERMTEAEFPTTNSIYDRVQEKRIVYAKGLKDMRSLLNHPPVMGEGEKESKYHFAREVIFTLRSCQAISIDVYLHWIEKLNKDENSPPPPHQANT